MTPRSQSFARCLSLMPMCMILRLCGQSSDVKQWQELGMVNIPLLPWMKVCKRPICYNGQTQKLKKMIVTLGSFHTQATFTKVIRKYLGVVRNVQYMGGVIGFWQNYCYKQTERKAVGLWHTSSQAKLWGAMEGSLASLDKVDTGKGRKCRQDTGTLFCKARYWHHIWWG